MANKPNNPSLWSRAKSLARQKFDVYPSAYANGWAAKWYKSKGGTWRKAEYGMEVPMMAEGGKPDWLMEAQLKAQGYSGDALRQKMESMAAGGEPQNAGFQALPEFVQAKILSNMAEGGEPNNPGFRALPEYVQQKIMDNMAYGGYIPEMGYGGAAQQAAIAIAMKKAGKKPKSMKDGGEPNGEMALGQMAAVQDKMRKLLQFVKPDDNLDPWIASKLAVMDHSADAIADYMMYGPDAQEMEMEQMKNGGYTVTRSNDRKGKTHKVTGPDGTVKYFGDSKLGQHPKDPERKKAFYARHKKNLAGNPYFRAFARATWEDGGTIPAPITSPYSREYMQALSNEYDQFYAPPRYYGKDDGYDAFYSHKRKSFPIMKEDSGPGWLTTYSDGAQGFTSGDKDTPPKQRPGRKYDYVESYVRDVENDMGIPARILELMKTKEYNKYRPEYQRLSYKSGGYIGQDGKRHMSSTPTWSGNAGYEEGGELPMAQLGMFNPMFIQNLSSIPQSMGSYVRNLRLKNPATYNESTGMFDSVYDRITKDDTRNLGFSDSGLYIKDEAKKLQNTLNTRVAKDIRQGVRDFNKNFGTNLRTGLVIGKKGRDTLNEMAGATQQLGMGIGALSAATDMFINNPTIKRENKQRQMFSGMSDSLFMPAAEDRGDYVAAGSRIGELRPDQYVANKGMYTGQFYPTMNMFETGGIIDEELSMPLGLVDLPTMLSLPLENKPAAPASASSGAAPRSSGANPMAENTWKDVAAEFQGVKHLGIWGDARHKKTDSDHNTGDALDIGITAPEQGNQIAQKMIKEAADRNVKYIIWNKQIWNPSVSNEWRPYKGNNPHTSHVHVSFNRPAKSSEDLGQISLTHNNPLNIHQGDFASKYGGKQGAKDGNGFVSIFPDMNTGIQAAKDLLFGPNYNTLTIEQARNKWVKGNINKPSESTPHIIKAMGGNKKIADLSAAEREVLLKEFAKWEGRQAYNKIKDMKLFADGGTYDEGGVYELSEDEIRSILSLGGNVEFV